MKREQPIEIDIPTERDLITNESYLIVPALYDREQTYNYLEFNNSTERLLLG